MKSDQLTQIVDRIEKIEARNQAVEKDKAWEISWTRRIALSLMTYVLIAVFLWSSNTPEPFFNALIPSIALILSGPSLNILKKQWLKRR